MNVRKLNIENFGSIKRFEAAFWSGLTVLKGPQSIYVALALRLLTKGELSWLDRPHFTEKTRLCAEIEYDGIYLIEITGEGENIEYKVFLRETGAECTDDFLKKTKQCREEQSFNFFAFRKNLDFPKRLCCYKDIEKYYPENTFAALTDSIGRTRSFRAELNRFIKNFVPEKLRRDKNFWLTLPENGEFRVVNSADGSRPFLSESEQVIYHYLCFLNVAEFWAGVEKIRDLNSVSRPLIITDFVERVDKTIDLLQYIKRTRALGRQTFLVCSCADSNPNIERIKNCQKVHIE